MTYAYSAGKTSRIEGFTAYFIEYYIARGYDAEIPFEFLFYKWSFCIPQKKKENVLRAKMLLKDSLLGTSVKHRFSIWTFIEEYDREEMGITFPSIFVHGVEATILYTLFALIPEINKLLIEAGLQPIYLFSNHDCLGINIGYSMLLEPLLMLAYNKVSSVNFLAQLKLNLKKNSVLRVSNPSFIRF